PCAGGRRRRGDVEVPAMRTVIQRLAAGVAILVLCLVTSGPTLAQGRFGGAHHGGGVGPGARPAGAATIAPRYYSTYDPFGYNYYLNRPGYNPAAQHLGRHGTYGYGYGYGY